MKKNLSILLGLLTLQAKSGLGAVTVKPGPNYNKMKIPEAPPGMPLRVAVSFSIEGKPKFLGIFALL